MEIARRICLAAAVVVWPLAMFGQNAVPDWQIAAGGQRSFDVASVKADAGPFRPPNFPLDAGDAFRPVGGHFSADFPLTTYITFAYRIGLTAGQRAAMVAHLPGWVATDRFDIQAEAQGSPTKDQMRLMMQSLLAERFQLKVHFEMQLTPVFAMVLVKPDKTGPKLRPHSEGVPCEATGTTKVFPPVCDSYMMEMSPNGSAQAGSRNTTLGSIAGALPGIGGLDRPVVDRTGLGGMFDFSIEFTPESRAASAGNAGAATDVPGSTFLEALGEQLGLKLEATKAPQRILVVDHVERPSQN